MARLVQWVLLVLSWISAAQCFSPGSSPLLARGSVMKPAGGMLSSLLRSAGTPRKAVAAIGGRTPGFANPCSLRISSGQPEGGGGGEDDKGIVGSLSQMSKALAASDFLTKPIEVTIPVAIAGWMAGSLSLTVSLFIFFASVSFGDPDFPPQTSTASTPAEITNAQKVEDSALLFSQILSDIDQAYVDPVEPDRLFETGVRAMLGSLDPYTEFENNKDSQNLDIMTYGRYGGVGLTIASDLKYVPGKGEVRDPSRIFVVDALEGYAWDAGVHTGDHIIKIGDVSVDGKELSEITSMLRGPPGSTVKVAFQRDGVQGIQEAELSRKSVRIKDVPVVSFMGPAADGVGYLLLKGFAVDSGKEVRDAIAKLEQQAPLKSLILDLRGNPGGLLTSAVDVAEIFLEPKAGIVSTKGRTNAAPTLSYQAGAEGKKLSKEVKVVVLTSGSTASAAEIVSGAIQDHDRGVIVGERTFGKGLVQQVARLPYETSLKLTVAKYYTPSGRCIQSVEYKEGGLLADASSPGEPSSARRDFRFGDSFRSRTYKDAERKTFTTTNGRIVRDGGGVEPDVFVPSERLSELELSLLEQNAFTLFVSEWSGAHPGALEKLASSSLAPASLVDDRVYAEFEKFIVDRGLVGKTRFDTALDELGQAFGESKLSSLQSSVQELKGRATKELLGNLVDEKPKIVKKLENALRSRIEPGSKRLMAMLQMDTTIARAVAIAKDSSQYTALLQPGITITSPSRGGPEAVASAQDLAPNGSKTGPGSGKVNTVGKN